MTSRDERKRELGQRIRLLRDTRGITVEQAVVLAEEQHGIKIHSNTWSNVESGTAGGGRTYAAIELVLQLERGACKSYVDDGGELPEVIKPDDKSDDDVIYLTDAQKVAVLEAASQDTTLEEYERALLAVVARKWRAKLTATDRPFRAAR